MAAADRNVCPNSTRPQPMSTTMSRAIDATRCSGGACQLVVEMASWRSHPPTWRCGIAPPSASSRRPRS